MEHLHTSHHRLARLAEPYNLDFVAGFDESSLDAPRHYGAAPFDAEDVLYGHEERQVLRPIGHRHVVVHCLHELDDALDILIVGITLGFQSLECADPDNGNVFAGEVVVAKELSNLQLHQLQQFRIVHGVHLVQRHDDAGHVDLPRQQYVLPSLGHRAVRGAHHQNGAIHLRRARDHVLDVVGVAGAVHVRVVTVRGLILHVGNGDRDTPGFLLWRLVDLVEGRIPGRVA